MAKSYRDLEVWRLGLDLVETVYRCTAEFPKSETFGLSAQMRRAAVSIPSNIAEGQARSSSKELLPFLSFSLGSLAELETQLELANRLGYMQAEVALGANWITRQEAPLPSDLHKERPADNQ
jgi:four helix bundle protein